MRKVYSIFLIFPLFLALHSIAQIDCGNNAGFEAGTPAGWVAKWGSYGTGTCPTLQNGQCPTFNTLLNNIGFLNTNGNNAPLNTGVDRHTIVDNTAYGTGFDPNTGTGPALPVIPPGGGNYTFRLGDGVTGGTGTLPTNYGRAESISLSFLVDTSNASFTYRYAAFLQDAGHWPEEQPRFEVLVKDALDSLIPCGYYKVIAGNINPSCPGVDTSKFHTGAANWHYTDWTSVGLDLSNYKGQVMTVEFRTSDCFPGQNGYTVTCPPSGCCTTTYNGVSCDCNNACTGTLKCTNQAGSHSAYVYIDAFCQPLTVLAPSVCVGQGPINICAPPGYLTYSWPYLPGSPTTQCVTIQNPQVGETDSVFMTTVTGCPAHTWVTLLGTDAITRDTTLCAGSTANVSLTVQPTTPGPHTYTWSGPNGFSSTQQNPVIPLPSVTTAFTVTVTDTTTCQVIKTETININQLPTPVIIPQNASICPGSSIMLTASGGTGYLWSNSGNTDTITVSPTAFTIYNVTVTDSNGCSNTANTSVSIYPPAQPIAITPPPICIGQSALLSASGGITYLWGPPLLVPSDTVTVTPTITTTYTVGVIDNNGCTGTATTTVTVNQLPTVIPSLFSSICIGGSAQLTASGGTSCAWSGPNIVGNPNNCTITANPNTASTYTVVVTDANTCVNSDTVSIGIYPPPVVNVSPFTSICPGSSTLLSASGGVSYVWMPGNIPGNTLTVSPNTFTTYTVIVTDINTCVNSDTVSVAINPLPVVNVTPFTSICPGSSTLLSASGGTGYVWMPGNIPGDTLTVSPNSFTTYTVIVTDAKGCVNGDTTSVGLLSIPQINTSLPTTVCVGTPTQISASTTSPNSTYSWSNVSNTATTTVAPTVTTTYFVTVTDANGCTNTASTTVSVNNYLSVIPSNATNICIGSSTTLTSSSPGATIFVWTPSGANTPNVIVSPTVTTTYTINVSNVNGCNGSDTVTVFVNPLPPVFVSSPATICLGSNTTISAGGGLQCSWSGPNGFGSNNCSSVITPSASGNFVYNVTITDNNGCSDTGSTNITVYPSVSVTVSPNVSICLDSTTQLSAMGGTTFNWSPPTSLNFTNIPNPIASPTVTTIYTVNVTDLNGCTGSNSVIVTVRPSPVANAGLDQDICIGQSANLDAGQSNNAFFYSWSLTTGQNFSTSPSPIVSPSSTTSYVVVVSNGSNCPPSADTVTVNVHPIPPIVAGTDTSILAGNSVSLTAAGGGISYLWSPSDGLSCATCDSTLASPLYTTQYIVTTMDIYGCVNQDTVLVNVDDIITLYVPNAFTPNGKDNSNGIFYAYGIGINQFEFYIFDRWGALLFETKDPYVGWDGTYNGQNVQQDVYVYLAKARSITGKSISKTGSVTVVR